MKELISEIEKAINKFSSEDRVKNSEEIEIILQNALHRIKKLQEEVNKETFAEGWVLEDSLKAKIVF